MTQFGTGATRSAQGDRIDPRGFISPKAMRVFCEYMLRNQRQADGRKRASDNWKRGMPVPRYMESFFRHSLALHEAWETFLYADPASEGAYEAYQTLIEHACAILFNIQGFLHEDELGTDLRDPVDGRLEAPYD